MATTWRVYIYFMQTLYKQKVYKIRFLFIIKLLASVLYQKVVQQYIKPNIGEYDVSIIGARAVVSQHYGQGI